MRRMPWLLILLPLSSAWAQGQADPAPAAEPAPIAEVLPLPEIEQKHPLEVRAYSLLEEIARRRENTARLLGKAEAARGIDRRLYERRYERAMIDQVEDVDRLVTVLLQAEAAEVDVAGIRRTFTRDTRRAVPKVVELIERRESELREFVTNRSETRIAERIAFERDTAERRGALTIVFTEALRYLAVVERLDVDVDKYREVVVRDLVERADDLMYRVQITQEEVNSYASRLNKGAEDADIQTLRDAAKIDLDAQVTALSNSTRLLAAEGVDVSTYERRLFETTGEITSQVFSREVLGDLFVGWRDRAITAVRENGPALLFKIGLFALILLISRGLARLARGLVERTVAVKTFRPSELFSRMAVSMASRFVMFIGVLVALGTVGIELGPLLAGLGFVSVVVGFALQDTLSNFAAGAMILFYRPFDIGDVVDVADGVYGKVDYMTLVSTKIVTFDNQTLIVPNASVWSNVIKNVTSQGIRRIELEFGIGYADNIRKAEKVLMELLKQHPKVLAKPEPLVKVDSLGESSVNFAVKPWVAAEDYFDVRWDITRAVKLRFDQEGIGIPFPQRDVHLYLQKDELPDDILEDIDPEDVEV